MATGFSVFVNIGGKVSPSLAAAVSATKAQLNGLNSTLAGVGARANAAFVGVQNQLKATQKTMASVQRTGRNLTLGLTMPAVWGVSSALKAVKERAEVGNMLESVAELDKAQKADAIKYADSLAPKHGDSTGIQKTLLELVKAGFDYNAARGSLESILSGSQIAKDISPDELGSTVSKIVKQFGLDMSTMEAASESARRVVDNIVYGALKTTGSTHDFSQSFNYVGSAAAAAGESIESTNAMIMALADRGVLNMKSGVALRSAYVRLMNPKKSAIATMSRLGLNLSDYVGTGKRTTAGVLSGMETTPYSMKGNGKEIDAALKQGRPEDQRKAIFDAVAKRYAKNAADRSAIMDAVDSVFTISGGKVDLPKLFTDLKAKGATSADLVKIFEGRQFSNLLGALLANLPERYKEVKEGTKKDETGRGYAQQRYDVQYQGLPAAMLRLDAAGKSLRNTLVELVADDLIGGMDTLSGALKSLAASNPGIMKVAVGLGAVAVAAGPVMFVAGSVGRLVTAIGLLAVNSARLTVATTLSGITKVGAVAVLAAKRVRAMAVGLLLLNATGGATAVLGAIGGSIAKLAAAPFLLVGRGLRAIGAGMLAIVSNPAGWAIAGVVLALTALGMWVKNNWEGVKAFFAGFGEGLMKGLGPEAGAAVEKIADGLGKAWDWLTKLLGPIDETGKAWHSWGETIGGVVASGVNAVVEAGSKLIEWLQKAIGLAKDLGSAIKNALGGGTYGANGIPQYSSSGHLMGVSPPARALGGPVTFGRPFLVGERGPELFVPGQTGRIETNARLRQLTADGTAAIAASTENNTRSVSFNPTINVSGGGADPRETASLVRSELRRLLAQMENEQQGLLSD